MEAKREEEGRKKITRRAALKRIALAAGSMGVLGSLHPWGTGKSGLGLADTNQPEPQRVAAYYSYKIYSSAYPSIYYSMARYNSTYSSTSYISQAYSSRYSSTSSSSYASYSSLASSPSRPGGCTRN
jgi:hypothetical protein